MARSVSQTSGGADSKGALPFGTPLCRAKCSLLYLLSRLARALRPLPCDRKTGADMGADGRFKFPVFYDGGEVRELSWDDETTVESVVLLTKV